MIQWSFEIQYESVAKKHPNMTHTHTNMSYIRLTHMSYNINITYGPHMDTYGTGWLPGPNGHHRCLLGDADVGPALGQHGWQDIEVQVRHFRQTLEAGLPAGPGHHGVVAMGSQL